MGYIINGVKYDYNSLKNQKIKKKFADIHIFSDVSKMVDYILLSEETYDGGKPFASKDVLNFYEPVCPECDSTYGFAEETDNTGKVFVKCCNCEEILDGISTLKDTNELNKEAIDVSEWYMVSDVLSKKLKNKGQCIIYKENIWGRTTCGHGQAVYLDNVISEICHEMQILDGQELEWSM